MLSRHSVDPEIIKFSCWSRKLHIVGERIRDCINVAAAVPLWLLIRFSRTSNAFSPSYAVFVGMLSMRILMCWWRSLLIIVDFWTKELNCHSLELFPPMTLHNLFKSCLRLAQNELLVWQIRRYKFSNWPQVDCRLFWRWFGAAEQLVHYERLLIINTQIILEFVLKLILMWMDTLPPSRSHKF